MWWLFNLRFVIGWEFSQQMRRDTRKDLIYFVFGKERKVKMVRDAHILWEPTYWVQNSGVIALHGLIT